MRINPVSYSQNFKGKVHLKCFDPVKIVTFDTDRDSIRLYENPMMQDLVDIKIFSCTGHLKDTASVWADEKSINNAVSKVQGSNEEITIGKQLITADSVNEGDSDDED